MAAAVGMLAQLGIDSATPVTKRFDFIRGPGPRLMEEFLDGNGLRGTLSHDISRNRQGIRRVEGPLTLQPNAVELALLLQWILGGTPSGTPTVTYPVGDSLVTRYVECDYNVGSKRSYSGCAVDRAVFRATQNGFLELDLDVVGQDETVSGSFPALSIDTANGPWLLTDCAITINATTVNPRQVEITIDNRIDKDRFFNSQTLVSTVKQDRQITFSCNLPFGDSSALYSAANSASGVAVVLTWTNANAILTQTMSKVAAPRRSPEIAGRQEVMWDFVGTAFANGATKELVTTLNPGP